MKNEGRRAKGKTGYWDDARPGDWRDEAALWVCVVVILLLAVLASGCVRIEHRPDGTWLYERPGLFDQPSLTAEVTTGTLKVTLNPDPARTEDIIRATADAVLAGAKGAAK